MESVEQILQPGRILYVDVQLPPRNAKVKKRMILVGFDEDGDPLLLKIYSNNQSPYWHTIHQSAYPSALAYDSYVDCGRVFVKAICEPELIASLHLPNSHHECLNDDDKRQLCLRIKQFITVSPIHKEIILNFFSCP